MDGIQSLESRGSTGRRRRAITARRRRRQIRAILAGGLVLGIGASGTFAAWTDQEQATGEFYAGKFQLEAYIDGTWGSTGQTYFNADDMYPGDDTFAPVFIRTSPDTTVDGELSVTASEVSGELAPYLYYRAVAIDNLTGAEVPENFTCDVSSFDNPDTSDYVYGSPDGPDIQMSDLPSAERSHDIAAGGTEVIAYCFHVQMPTGTGNEAQGQEATHTWTWNAESVEPS